MLTEDGIYDIECDAPFGPEEDGAQKGGYRLDYNVVQDILNDGNVKKYVFTFALVFSAHSCAHFYV